MRGEIRAYIGRRWMPIAIGGLMVLLLPVVAMAATEAEKQAAINSGLSYLSGQQQVNGSWRYDGTAANDTAATGAALLAFIQEGHTPWSGTAYSTKVANGLAYLYSQARVSSISNQTYGNPDKHNSGVGAGVGVSFASLENHHETYASGHAVMALAALGSANSGKVINAPGSSVHGWTVRQVVENGVDWFAYGQNESGTTRGGWGYEGGGGQDAGWSDQSNSQWPVVALAVAKSKMGVTAPTFVASELNRWTDYIQHYGPGQDGGSDYPPAHNWGSNVSRTGTLVLQQDYAGKALSDGRVQAALGYLDNQWNTTANSTWNGNYGHAYAMWAAYKGLESTIGLDDNTEITNLPGLTTWRATASLDAGDTYNWWESYCEYLVATQQGAGNWNGYSYWGGPLQAAYYINILAATQIGGPVVPEPSTIALLGLGLAGFAFAARRRRKAA